MPMPETSETTIDIPQAGLCRLDIGWVFIRRGCPHQRVRVTLHGVMLGEVTLIAPCAIEFIAPSGGVAQIGMPDAKSPLELGINQDNRVLSIGIGKLRVEPSPDQFDGLRTTPRDIELMLAATGLTSAELAMKFMGLGTQCEFGLVQREMGAEPHGLLRFSNTPLDALLRLLEGRCEGLGAPGTLEMTPMFAVQEFVGEDKIYGLRYHTWKYATSTTAEAVLEQETARLPFLARHLVERLEDAELIFIYKTALVRISDDDVRKLHDVLRSYGPNRLLVVQTEMSDPGWKVERLGDGLWRGFIPYEGPSQWELETAWMPMLTWAYLMISEAGGASSPQSAQEALTLPNPLFDAVYYLTKYTDVAAAGADPFEHYMKFGWKEGRNPCALFNTNYYLNQNPDVKAAEINPLAHFEAIGRKEGRNPSLNVAVSRYKAANPDVAAAGFNPLAFLVTQRPGQGRVT